MKKFLVWGLGKSGRSAAELLQSKGFQSFSGDDARGDRWEEFIDEVDTIVLSPGIPPSHPLWKTALRKEIEIIGELELAYRFFEGRVIAITGTDGKSTTTRLTYLMLSSHFENVHEAGNIGRPLSDVVLENPDGIAVLEVSSFQGKTLSTFKPEIGAFLNFSPDHLDWHPDIKDYLESKYNIFVRQESTDYLLINGNQDEVRNAPTKAEKIDVTSGVRIERGKVLFRDNLLFELSDLKMRGQHNLMNAVFSSLVAFLKGVPVEKIREVLRSFRGLPFRMEHIATINGVEIYNDSKSTTPNSLRAALESFPDRSIILIAGGKDKGADFESLREIAQRKVKAALLIGETKDRIRSAFGSDLNTRTLNSLEDAVKEALRIAEPGDFILFSPGCSSFDMFSSYVERGEVFNKLIRSAINYKYV